jgi:hypothetical protein
MNLTDSQVDDICAGLKQNSAKVRYLQGLGLVVKRKPNGRPLVNEEHYRMVMTASASQATILHKSHEPIWGVH